MKPDLALEYAWRFNMYEFVMPFIIQMVSEMKSRDNEVYSKLFRLRKSKINNRRKLLQQLLILSSVTLD